MTLIEAVSELVDADPTETPLYLNDDLDLDALDRLFNSMEGAASFNFTYGDYNINYCSEGEITITGCDVCHGRGHATNPASMRMTTEIEAPRADD